MIHDVTIGHFDPASVSQHGTIVLKLLEMHVVHRLLEELGGRDASGQPTLGGGKVRFEDGYLVVPWLCGWANRISEEFAIRLRRETGCLITDMSHCRVIDPEQLQGLNRHAVAAQEAPAR